MPITIRIVILASTVPFMALSASCMPGGGEGSAENSASTGGLPAGSAACGEWTNPAGATMAERLGLVAVDVRGGEPARMKLDCAKNVVIYVHGWNRRDPEAFPEAQSWAARGWQPFVFRWYDLAHGPDPATIYLDRTPVAAKRFEEAVAPLLEKLGVGGFKGEVRVVSHSFGAAVAVSGVSALETTSVLRSFSASNGPASVTSGTPGTGAAAGATAGSRNTGALSGTRPVGGTGVPGASPSQSPRARITRVALLDPALFLDFKEGLRLCDKVGIRSRLATQGPFAERAADTSLHLSNLAARGVRFETYASIVSSAFSSSLASRLHVQNLASGPTGCGLFVDGASAFEVHTRVVGIYFKSITGTSPKRKGGGTGFAASTPTSALQSGAALWRYAGTPADLRSGVLGRFVFEKAPLSSLSPTVEVGGSDGESGGVRVEGRVTF